VIEIRLAPGFRAQWRRFGFTDRALNLTLRNLSAEVKRGLPRPRSDGYYWFARATAKSARDLVIGRAWIGGQLEGDALILREVRTEDPDP